MAENYWPVTLSGAAASVGTVDVQPLAGQLDGAGKVVAHGVISGIPYLRLTGGSNPVVLDPQEGDIDLVAIGDRDCSSVLANAGAAAPGIDIVSPSQTRLAAPIIVLQADKGIGLTAGSQITDSAPEIELDSAISQAEGPQGDNAKMAVQQAVTAAGTQRTWSQAPRFGGRHDQPPPLICCSRVDGWRQALAAGAIANLLEDI